MSAKKRERKHCYQCGRYREINQMIGVNKQIRGKERIVYICNPHKVEYINGEPAMLTAILGTCIK